MNLYICSTYYHVFITLLKQVSSSTPADLVICDDLSTGDQLASRIEKYSFFHNVWFVKQHSLPAVSSKGWVDAVLFQHKRRAQTIRPLLPFHLCEYQNIYIYHDGTALGAYLNDERCPYHLIEDSLNFYQYIQQSSQAHLLYPHTLRYYVRRFLRAGYFPLGYSPYLIDIEVNENRNLQIKSKHTVEKSRFELFQNLTPEIIQILFSIFGYAQRPNISNNSAILLTQPLSQDAFCDSVDEHYQIYAAIIAHLRTHGYSVFLKPHPRDNLDYSSFPVTIIDKNIPCEIFALDSSLKFNCAITISSSSILNFPAQHLYYWDIQNKVMIPVDKNKEFNL